MSLNRSHLHTHIEDGGLYELIDAAALLKHPDTGAWVAGVIYRDADPWSARWRQTYATTEERWIGRFMRAGATSPAPQPEEVEE